MTQSARSRSARRDEVRQLAARQHGVVSRQQVYVLGVTRWAVTAEVRAGRWKSLGRQTLLVLAVESPTPRLADFYRAVFEVGADAAIDGVSALQAAGLAGYDETAVPVSVSKGSRFSRPAGVHVHETRRRRREDLVGIGLPRVRAHVAAVRGSLWARTNRQGALVLVMAVQQRIARVPDIADAFQAVKRHRRRGFLLAVLRDIADGAQAMGELDFARLCRRRGLPKPDRQVVRRGRDGRVYLDVFWDRWRSSQIHDTIRQNDLTVEGESVLRVPVVGLRDCPDTYLEQLEALLRRSGWTGHTRAA